MKAYIKVNETFNYEDGECIELKGKSYTVELGYTRRYTPVFEYLAGLNSCAHDLMEYIVNRMNEKGLVTSDSKMRNGFIESVVIATKKFNETVTYSDSNVKKAFQKLTERGCLIKMNKGIYRVNPELYYNKTHESRRDEKSERCKAIKQLMEFKNGVRDSDLELVGQW